MSNPRTPLYDLARSIKGAGFTAEQVAAMEYAFDRAGIPKEVASGFDAALTVILAHEGGFVDDPKDPGGMTNLGVTSRTYGEWIGRTPTEAEMRALKPADVAPIYRKNYWDRLRCDDLHPGIALVAFDHGVNAGTSRSAKILQKLCGVVQDGVIGPASIEAAKRWVAAMGPELAITQFSAEREAYYRSLAQFPRYGKGWLRRVDETEAAAKALS